MLARRALVALCWVCGACEGERVVLGDGRVTDGGDDAEPVLDSPRVIAALVDGADNDDDPTLTEDLTLLLFNSKREGGQGKEDIWTTRRSARTEPWSAPTPVGELNSAARETGIALSADGLLVLFSSDREGGAGGLDVYQSHRASRQDVWSTPAPVTELCSQGDDLVSALSSDGSTIYFARRDDEDEDYDLWVAKRGADTRFADVRAIAELNTAEEESDAFVLRGGDLLLFTRAGDLQRSERRNDSYAAPTPLTAFNTPDDDRDLWMSASGDYAVFSSNRSGSYLLYEVGK